MLGETKGQALTLNQISDMITQDKDLDIEMEDMEFKPLSELLPPGEPIQNVKSQDSDLDSDSKTDSDGRRSSGDSGNRDSSDSAGKKRKPKATSLMKALK